MPKNRKRKISEESERIQDESHFSNILSQLATQDKESQLWTRKKAPSPKKQSPEKTDSFLKEFYEQSSSVQNSQKSSVLEILVENETKVKEVTSKKIRVPRKVTEFLGQVSIVFAIAHLKIIHKVLQKSLLRALALSLFPQGYFQEISLIKLGGFVSWFKKESTTLYDDKIDEVKTLEETLAVSCVSRIFSSSFELVLAASLYMKSVGWKTRVIYSPYIFGKHEGKATKKSSKKQIGQYTSYWIEVYVDSCWITVDVVSGKINCTTEMEARTLFPPLLFAFCLNDDGSLKDLSPKYVLDYGTRKNQIPTLDWVQKTLSIFSSSNNPYDKKENELLKIRVSEFPIPSSLTALKTHALYVTPKHLLKYEVLYPPNVSPIGRVKNELVYDRKYVHRVKSKNNWFKMGMEIKANEIPFKVMYEETDPEKGSKEFYGPWQTTQYVPPKASNGKVPRNEYGNVEIYKPWMIPSGTTHLPINGLQSIAAKLNIDAAPAVIGWEYHKGGSHPLINGFVVCNEFTEILMDAWNTEMDVKAKTKCEKREHRVLVRWKKLTLALLLRQKIYKKYK